MPTFAIRITVPYEQLSTSPVFTYLVERSNVLIIAQHDETTSTGSTVHCHIHANVKVGYDSVNNIIKTNYRGNAEFSVKTEYGKNPYKLPVDDGNVTYILKGKLTPRYMKGMTEDEMITLRSKWVDRNVRNLVVNNTSPVDNSGPFETAVKIINPLLKTQNGQYDEIMKELNNLTYNCECSFCKMQHRSSQSTFPVKWDHSNVHQNRQYAVKIVHAVRKEANQLTDMKTLEKFLWMIYHFGHELENDYSHIFSRLNI